MEHIIKICVDNLRNHSQNHGIKLKASHAHELVASYFGYKSRSALLEDKLYPLSNLRQASIITLAPINLVEQRRYSLQNLPSDLPDTDTLREWFYSSLLTEEWFASKFHPNYKKLAEDITCTYLRKNQVYYSPLNEGLDIERDDDCIRLTVHQLYYVQKQMVSYLSLYNKIHQANITITILLKRIAGHVGYAEPEISSDIENLK